MKQIIPFLILIAVLVGCREGSRNLATESVSPESPETFSAPAEVVAACDGIARLLRKEAPEFALRVEKEKMFVGPRGDRKPGCRVLSAARVASVAGRARPDEIVRVKLPERGWKEDPLNAADGSGTTAFALRKGSVLCRFQAGAPASIVDGEVVPAERYKFEAECMADAAEGESKPGL